MAVGGRVGVISTSGVTSRLGEIGVVTRRDVFLIACGMDRQRGIGGKVRIDRSHFGWATRVAQLRLGADPASPFGSTPPTYWPVLHEHRRRAKAATRPRAGGDTRAAGSGRHAATAASGFVTWRIAA